MTNQDATPDPLAALQRDFPTFDIWRETTLTGARYIARSRHLNQSPHTLVTRDPDELRAALAAATIPAQSWRLRNDRRPCPHCGDDLCPACTADWDQADRYHELARALGAIASPRHRSATRLGTSQPPSIARCVGVRMGGAAQDAEK